MSNTENTKRMKTLPILWRCVLAVVPLALAVSCGDATPTFVVPPGGSGGTGSSLGTGGMAGNAGGGGMSGAGGAGTGGPGAGGAAGSGGSAGTGGTGSTAGACVTTAVCHTCPSEVLIDALLCDVQEDDCDYPGYVCVPSGCTTLGGAPIGQCQAAPGVSCAVDTDCPNVDEYGCKTVGAGGKRCVRVEPGCDPATESYDCALGFSCKDGACVDRRLPCDSTNDCPKSHICHVGTPTGSFCARVYRTCAVSADCVRLSVRLGWCDNVDGDAGGTMECSGTLGAPEEACVNTMCPPLAPVCENGALGTGTSAVCRDYGLCRSDSDCRGGFVCLALGQDGRKECVLPPGPNDCTSATDCPPQQVCAAPRDGGSPSCQAGKEAM